MRLFPPFDAIVAEEGVACIKLCVGVWGVCTERESVREHGRGFQSMRCVIHGGLDCTRQLANKPESGEWRMERKRSVFGSSVVFVI